MDTTSLNGLVWADDDFPQRVRILIRTIEIIMPAPIGVKRSTLFGDGFHSIGEIFVEDAVNRLERLGFIRVVTKGRATLYRPVLNEVTEIAMSLQFHSQFRAAQGERAALRSSNLTRRYRVESQLVYSRVSDPDLVLVPPGSRSVYRQTSRRFRHCLRQRPVVPAHHVRAAAQPGLVRHPGDARWTVRSLRPWLHFFCSFPRSIGFSTDSTGSSSKRSGRLPTCSGNTR